MSDGRDRSDEQLFDAYLGGNEAAFAEIVVRWAPTVRRLIARERMPATEVDELVQDVFLQLHRSAPDFRVGSPLRPYLVTIALNLRREVARRRIRRAKHPPEPDWTSHVPAPHERRAEARDQVDVALSGLPVSQREVIELHWFAGLPFAEIAHVVGASVSAVKVRAHRGYERMRAILGVEAA